MGTPLPHYDTDNQETHCCSLIDPKQWDGLDVTFDTELFAKISTCSLFYVPLNMGPELKKAWRLIEKAKAQSGSWVMLSKDLSPWKAEHYLAVSKGVPGLDVFNLPGTFVTKVFEGPYKNAPKWMEEMRAELKGKGREAKDFYFFYTECPKCAKHFGKNYVVLFAKV